MDTSPFLKISLAILSLSLSVSSLSLGSPVTDLPSGAALSLSLSLSSSTSALKMSEKENKGFTGAAGASSEQTPPFLQPQQYYGTFQGIPSYTQPPPQPVVGFPQPAPSPGTAPPYYYAHGYQAIPGNLYFPFSCISSISLLLLCRTRLCG